MAAMEAAKAGQTEAQVSDLQFQKEEKRLIIKEDQTS